MILITPRCQICGKNGEMEVDAMTFTSWQLGTLIQDAFPTLSDGEREMIQTGTHEECWEVLFPPENE
jgi:hypothetical protein